MRIVDHDQRRAAIGDGCRQPVQAVQNRERVVLRAGGALGPVARRHDRRGASRGAGQQRAALVACRRANERLEQLAHHAVGEVALQLAAAADQYGDPGALRDSPRLVQQDRLADAGHTLDEDQRALTCGEPIGQVGEL